MSGGEKKDLIDASAFLLAREGFETPEEVIAHARSLGWAPKVVVRPPEPPIAAGCTISSKGCAIRYSNTTCPCLVGTCWVTYARNQMELGESALRFKEWMAAGSAMQPFEPKLVTVGIGRKKQKRLTTAAVKQTPEGIGDPSK